MASILRFLALQDVLLNRSTTDPAICATIARLHFAAGVTAVAPCRYFTSAAAVERHLAYGLPVDAPTLACRSFLQGFDPPRAQKLALLVGQCVRETYPLTFSADVARPSCGALTAFGNKTLSGWSARLVGLDQYALLGGGPPAVAAVCYPPVLGSVVDAGQTIDQTLRAELEQATAELDAFVSWYLTPPPRPRLGR